MASAPFVALASALVEAMGQRLDAAKPTEEGLVLRTEDGFLYAFLEDPNNVSLDTIGRLFGGDGLPVHLVVLTPGHLPLALQLGLETMLGEEPRRPPKESRRLLPSAQQLDDIMHRARTWLDWGVPALALRFFRQAGDLKPSFLPAKTGRGRALLALGLVADADRLFDEVLAARPDDVEARLGKAAVLGAKALPKQEVEMYRALLAEDQARTEVRAHLVAALVDLGDWAGARVEIEALLARTPEDPSLRFLHSVALSHTGKKSLADEEREESRRLGLTYEREVALCQHLGLPAPPRPLEGAPTPPAAAVAPMPKARRPAVRPKAKVAPKPSAPTRRTRPAARPSAAPRKRK
jgi:tetratricopeptide (TPR) repeat protein